MDTHAVNGVQEVVTQRIPVTNGTVTNDINSKDTVTTEETASTADATKVVTDASEDENSDAESDPSAKFHRRTRQRKSFTMDDDVYKLLGSLAKTNSTNRSAFIEQLILMATRAGMTRTKYLEMLLLKADAVVTWQPPQLKPKPWWKPWAKPEWEEPVVPLVSRIVEGPTHPQLPPDGRQ